jgi:putative transposase
MEKNKLWKLKKIKSHERKTFKFALNAISRQIFSFAELLGSGIKFKKLFSPGCSHRQSVDGSFMFSFENGSLYALQQQVEKKAGVHGVPVIYVNPAYTKKTLLPVRRFGKTVKETFRMPALRVYGSCQCECRV